MLYANKLRTEDGDVARPSIVMRASLATCGPDGVCVWPFPVYTKSMTPAVHAARDEQAFSRWLDFRIFVAAVTAMYIYIIRQLVAWRHVTVTDNNKRRRTDRNGRVIAQQIR